MSIKINLIDQHRLARGASPIGSLRVSWVLGSVKVFVANALVSIPTYYIPIPKIIYILHRRSGLANCLKTKDLPVPKSEVLKNGTGRRATAWTPTH